MKIPPRIQELCDLIRTEEHARFAGMVAERDAYQKAYMELARFVDRINDGKEEPEP